jgi:hypothetical protein
MNDVRQFWTIFDPPSPYCHTFCYLGLSTDVTKSLTPPPLNRDVIYGRHLTSSCGHGRPQTSFQGRAKFSGGGRQKLTIGQKNTKKDTIFLKKSKNIIFGLQRLAGGIEALPDAHACALVNLTTINVF